MATITVPSDPTLPVAGAEIKAAPLKDWINNIKSFLESTSIDEANVDTAGTDGIVGKSIAQTITGLKTFSNVSAAAGGLREVAKFEINPASGTPAANDGLRMTFTADDAGGSATAIGYLDLKMTDASASSEDSEWRISTISNASSVTPLVVNATSITMTTGTVAIGTNATVGGTLAVTGTATFSGEVDAATLDISGNADIDGTLEADAITLGGTALGSLYSPIAGSTSIVTVGTIGTGTWQGTTIASAYLDSDTAHLSGSQTFTGDKVFTGTLTVGVDGTGKDVTFYGDTSGSKVVWDESADDLVFTNAGIAVGSDATGDIYYRNSSGFLAKLAIGSNGQILTSNGTVPSWGAAGGTGDFVGPGSSTDNAIVRYDGTTGKAGQNSSVLIDDSNNATGFANVTLSGELDAATGDFSGDVDVDGTLEADAITLGGTALGSLYSPIAGSTSITTVGTIGTGTWQGTVIASAYLDSDTAHLTGTQTFTGAKTFTNTVTVGANDAGHDVILYGDTASANMTWDTSADDLILNGSAGLIVPDGQLTLGSTAVSSTASEINLLDALSRGSILYGNASGATAILTKGGANTVLTSDGTDISWATPSGVDATNGADNRIATFTDSDTINGEANLRYDGSKLEFGAAATVSSSADGFVLNDGSNAGMTIHSTGTSSGQAKLALNNANGADDGAALIYSNSNNKFILNSNGAVERFSIDANGFTTITNSTSSTPYGLYLYGSGGNPNNTTVFFLKCESSTETKAFIYSDGSFTSRANSYGADSDLKLKQDITDARSYWNDFAQVKFRKFRFKNDVTEYGDNAPSMLGVVAQEIESIFPNLVTESPDTQRQEVPILDSEGNDTGETEEKDVDLGTTTKAVKYSILNQIGLKVIQELQTRLEAAETKIAALEAA